MLVQNVASLGYIHVYEKGSDSYAEGNGICPGCEPWRVAESV
jgi:hypothetical protein